MPGKTVTYNRATATQNGDHNIIIQNSSLNQPVFCSGGLEMVQVLGALGQYDTIQEYVTGMLSAVNRLHPLQPDFGVKVDERLQKLVSTPETEDALKKYPKRIKSTVRVNYQKYPYMDRSETPWEYAYRTQTPVELETTAYQEFLGDMEDPFPVHKYEDGMVSVIKAPEFPPAICAQLSAGEVSIPISLRRQPCMEYGALLFGTTPDAHCGFSLKITTRKDSPQTNATFEKAEESDLSTQLQRERFLVEVGKTRKMKITAGTGLLFEASLSEEEAKADIFQTAPYMVQYLKNLLTIEKYTACKFDPPRGGIPINDYMTALVMAASLAGKWQEFKMEFDRGIRCDYDRISDDFQEGTSGLTEIVIEAEDVRISLQGQDFSAEQYHIVYRDAKLHNLQSVQKRRKGKKKNILLTFCPAEGKKNFRKFCRFEGIQLCSHQS